MTIPEVEGSLGRMERWIIVVRDLAQFAPIVIEIERNVGPALLSLYNVDWAEDGS